MYGHGTISKIKHLSGKKLKSKAQCKLCMHTKLQALYIHTCTSVPAFSSSLGALLCSPEPGVISPRYSKPLKKLLRQIILDFHSTTSLDWETIKALPFHMGAQEGWGALTLVFPFPQ